MNTIMFIASLIAMAVGLASYLAGAIRHHKYSGIGYKEFISSQYMMAKIPFATNVNKRLILRRMDMSDIADIEDMPNWILMMLSGNDVDSKKAIEDISKKSDKELNDDTKKLYAMLQKMAERVIVGYPIFKAEWQKVDPEYTGTLPKITLDAILAKETAQASKYIKKKSSYSALRLLATFGQEPHQNISTTKD